MNFLKNNQKKKSFIIFLVFMMIVLSFPNQASASVGGWFSQKWQSFKNGVSATGELIISGPRNVYDDCKEQIYGGDGKGDFDLWGVVACAGQSPSTLAAGYRGTLYSLAERGALGETIQGWANATTEAAAPVAAILDDPLGEAPDHYLGGAFKYIASTILSISVWIFSASGKLFDVFVHWTISSVFYSSGTITIAWVAFRDIANMVFIFALLYLSITTVLGITGAGIGKQLTTIIIAALLINFSMPMTRVIIDASNILANEFIRGASTDGSLSATFVKALKFDDGIFTKPGEIEGLKTAPGNNTTQGLIFLGASMLLVVAGFVFLAGGFILMGRTFALVMLVIFSPMAFAAYALNDIGGYGKQWLRALFNYSALAPVFCAILWVTAKITSSEQFLNITGVGMKYDDIFSVNIAAAGTFPVAMLFSYIIVLTLLIMAIVVSKSLAPTLANGAMKAAGTTLGLGAATAALAGRQTVGRAAQAVVRSGVGRGAGASRLGRITRSAANYASTSGFDARGVPGVAGAAGLAGVNLGAAGGAGGYAAGETARRTQERERAQADSLQDNRSLARSLAAGAGPVNAAQLQSIRNMSGADITRLAESDSSVFQNAEFVRHLNREQLEAIAGSEHINRQTRIAIAGHHAGTADVDVARYLTASPAAHRWR